MPEDMRKSYVVQAKRWKHGWELHVEGVGVTQADSLNSAAKMARDYIGLVENINDKSTFDVEIHAQDSRPIGTLGILIERLDTLLDAIPTYEEGRWFRYGDWGCRLRLSRLWWRD